MAITEVQQPPVQRGPPVQPDIEYTPDEEKYRARTKRRLETEDLSKTLPDGFPAQLNSSLVWEGSSLAKTFDWNYKLSAEDIDEIEAALKHFQCKQTLPRPQWNSNKLTAPPDKL